MVIDPVCKMEMQPKDAAATSEYAGKTYYFCHINCKNKNLTYQNESLRSLLGLPLITEVNVPKPIARNLKEQLMTIAVNRIAEGFGKRYLMK